MKYCKLCVLPETKPDLFFNEDGICSACLNHEARKDIDWAKREVEFLELFSGAAGKNVYDLVVPVSGGKDSHAQIFKCLELGLKPLAVNARTCHLSTLGRRNLDNLSRYCDLIEVAPNIHVRRQLNKFCLEMVGDISWPEHVSIFTIPVQVAVNYQIPFILWGENPQNEYGGPNAGSKTLDRAWLEEFGGLLGLRVSDLPFSANQLAPYTYPDPTGVRGVFMGHYFPWDGYANADVARDRGFEWATEPVQASGFKYENLDNYQTGIHDFFKYLKYGFSRATDIASTLIRKGRLSRDDGVGHVLRWDGRYPFACLDVRLNQILGPLAISVDEFDAIAESFCNRSILEGPLTDLRVIDGLSTSSDSHTAA